MIMFIQIAITYKITLKCINTDKKRRNRPGSWRPCSWAPPVARFAISSMNFSFPKLKSVSCYPGGQNTSPLINVCNIVANVIPLCSIHQAPSHVSGLSMVAQGSHSPYRISLFNGLSLVNNQVSLIFSCLGGILKTYKNARLWWHEPSSWCKCLQLISEISLSVW